MAILELKIGHTQERQIVTELSAYSQGLQNKFRGLSFFDFIWIPISNSWRVMPKSAIEFQMVWNKVLCLPLTLNYSLTGQDVQSVELQCFNPSSEIGIENYISLFTYNSYDALDFYATEPISNPDALNQFISSLCSKYNISGFSLYHKPNDLMYSYGLTICVFNPYKSYLITRFLKWIKENEGEAKMYENIKEINASTDFWDIDFKTDEFKEWIFSEDQMEGKGLKHDAFWDKDFLSVGEFANNPENNKLNLLVDELKSHLQLIAGNKFAFGYPDFKTFFKNNTKENPVEKVIYFGFFQEIINQMLRFDFEKLNKTGNNKKLEAIDINDPLIAISDFKYLEEFMKTMNYE